MIEKRRKKGGGDGAAQRRGRMERASSYRSRSAVGVRGRGSRHRASAARSGGRAGGGERDVEAGGPEDARQAGSRGGFFLCLVGSINKRREVTRPTPTAPVPCHVSCYVGRRRVR